MTLIDKLVRAFPDLNGPDNIKKLEHILSECSTEQEKYYKHLNDKRNAELRMLELDLERYKKRGHLSLFGIKVVK